MIPPLQIVTQYLLFFVTLSYCFGIFSGGYFHIHFSLSLFLALSLFVFLSNLSKYRKVSLAGLLLCFFIGGVISYSHSLSPPIQADHVNNLISKETDTVVIGRLHKAISAYPQYTSIIINLDSIRVKDEDFFRKTTGLVKIIVTDRWDDTILPGDLLAIRTTLEPIPKKHTLGTFDTYRYHANKNIFVKGYTPTHVHFSKLHSPLTPIEKIMYFPERVRQKVGLFLFKNLDYQTSGIYKALLTGDRSSVSNTITDLFKASGCMHILAISGLHLSILGLFLFYISFKLLSLSETLMLKVNIRKVAALIALPILCFYSLLAGSGTPVIRALLMTLVCYIALITDRPKTPITLLSFALLLLSFLYPFSLFNASLQLSFTAVIFIYLFIPLYKKLFFNSTDLPIHKKLLNWFFGPILISIAATLGTMPVILYHFNEYHWWGLYLTFY